MKRMIIVLGTLLIMSVVSGCELELTNPESLIKPPLSNGEKLSQKRIITEFLSVDESLTVPINMDNSTAFFMEDFDNDGNNEMVAFYHNTNNVYEQGVMILKENQSDEGGWHVAQRIVESGSNIDYFNAVDLNGDGQKEFLFGLKSLGYNNYLHCYMLLDGKWEKLGRIQYDTISIHPTEKGQMMVALLRDIFEVPVSSQINLYYLDGEEIVNQYEATVDGYCKSVVFGQFSRERKGIGLAMQHNQYSSVSLLLEEDDGYVVALDEPLAYDYEADNSIEIFNDINNDGVIEVGYLQPPIEDSGNHPKNDYLKVWYQWQENDGLQAVQAILNHSNEGHEFLLPIQWLDQMEYGFEQANSIEWIDFYTKDNPDSEMVKVFSLTAIDSYTWETLAEDVKEKMILLGNNPNKKKVYLAMIHPVVTNMNITANQLISCLRIDGGK